MNISNPQDPDQKREPYTYINGFGFISQTDDNERKQLSSTCNLLFFSLLLYLIIKRLILVPSYYLSAIIGTQVWLNPMTGLMTMSDTAYQTAALLTYVISAGLVLAMVWFATRRELNLRQLFWIPDLPYACNSFWMLCGVAVTGIFCAELFTRLLAHGGLMLPSSSFNPPVSERPFLLYFISTILLPPLFEELFFRGIMLQLLRRFDDFFAILVSAVLFGMMQSSAHDMIFAVIFGAALGYIALKNGGLLICMAASFFVRLLRLIIWFLDVTMDSVIPNLLAAGILLAVLLLAIAAFIRRVRRNPHAFELKKDTSLLTNREKLRVVVIHPLFWCLCVLCITRMLNNLEFIN